MYECVYEYAGPRLYPYSYTYSYTLISPPPTLTPHPYPDTLDRSLLHAPGRATRGPPAYRLVHPPVTGSLEGAGMLVAPDAPSPFTN